MVTFVSRLLVLAALLPALPAFAGDQPDGDRSAQLAVSVTVVRANNTASAEVPVQYVHCVEEGNLIRCGAVEPPKADTLNSVEGACAASDLGTICWY